MYFQIFELYFQMFEIEFQMFEIKQERTVCAEAVGEAAARGDAET
jgi:hypothetical protein